MFVIYRQLRTCQYYAKSSHALHWVVSTFELVQKMNHVNGVQTANAADEAFSMDFHLLKPNNFRT